MTRARFVASSLLASALALGCLIDIPGDDTQTSTASTTGGGLSGTVTGAPVSTTDETAGDSMPTMATAATTGLDTSTGTASTGACGFLCNDMPAQCDNWAQDCPRGQKCAAYAPNGSAWNASSVST